MLRCPRSPPRASVRDGCRGWRIRGWGEARSRSPHGASQGADRRSQRAGAPPGTKAAAAAAAANGASVDLGGGVAFFLTRVAAAGPLPINDAQGRAGCGSRTGGGGGRPLSVCCKEPPLRLALPFVHVLKKCLLPPSASRMPSRLGAPSQSRPKGQRGGGGSCHSLSGQHTKSETDRHKNKGGSLQPITERVPIISLLQPSSQGCQDEVGSRLKK